MVLSTSTTKIGWSLETNYAGGVAGAKYACTQIANNATLTAMNMLKSAANLGTIETERMQMKPVSAGADTKIMINKGIRYKEFTMEIYVQSATWAAEAKAAKTAGSIPVSYVFHVEEPGVAGAIDYFDIFGCVLIEYEFTQAADGDFSTEKLTFSYYDMKDGVAHSTLAGLLATQPMTHKDTALSIDADAIGDLISCKYKITINTLDKKVATKYQRFDPVVISRDVELEAVFYTDSAAVIGDELALGGVLVAASTIEVPVVITIFTATTITNAKMYVDSSSIGEIPEEAGVYEYTVKMKSGGANALS